MAPNDTMTFGVDLLPQTNDSFNLGTSTQKWKLWIASINNKDFTDFEVASTADVQNSAVEILDFS